MMNSKNNYSNPNEQINWYTVAVCIVASSGALLFGLDVGITGGVVAMPSFQRKFFPDVYAAQQKQQTDDDAHKQGYDAYCAYNSQILGLFTSSFFLTGILSSVVASGVTSRLGRKGSMVIGAIFYIIGSALGAGACNTPMLVIGRLVLGLGVGFCNQAVPLFLAEIPPPSVRGSLQIIFQVSVKYVYPCCVS